MTLAEASGELGGRAAVESRLPGLSEWKRVADYRDYQISQMANVATYLNSPLTAEQVLEFEADHVAIATGARWCDSGMGRANHTPIPRSDAAKVVKPDAIFAGHDVDGPVVIFDDDHFYMGGLIAELLRSKGHDVTLVTTASEVSSWTHNTLEQERIQGRLIEMDVRLVPLHNVTAVTDGSATLSCVYTDRTQDIPCATFVPVTMRLPVDALYQELLDRTGAIGDADPKTLTRIGDCLGPSTIAAAVYSGHRFARELGEAATDAVPFRRELIELAAE